MTDPTADAAKLLPCPFCGSAPVACDDDSYGNSHVLCQGCDIGFSSCDFPAVCTGTKECRLATIIKAWNTRPQPAPPAGEPDFKNEVRHFFKVQHYAEAPVDQLAEFGERMYHLGLAARSKVEDGDAENFGPGSWRRLLAQLKTAKADLRVKETQLAQAEREAKAIRLAQHMLIDKLSEQALRVIDEAIGGCCDQSLQQAAKGNGQ